MLRGIVRLLAGLGALLAGTLTGLGERRPHSFVTMEWRGSDVVVPETALLAVLLAAAALSYVVLRLIVRTADLPEGFVSWRIRSRSSLAERRFDEALEALGAGRYRQASAGFARVRDLASGPPERGGGLAVGALGALAAYRVGDRAALRAHLAALSSLLPPSLRALPMFFGDWLEGESSASAKALERALETPAGATEAALWLARARIDSAQPERLGPVLAALRASRDLRSEIRERFEGAYGLHGLTNAADPTALGACWRSLPAMSRRDPRLLAAYANRARSIGMADGDAAVESLASLVQDGIERSWNADLLRCFASLPGPDLLRRVAVAEGWLVRRPGDTGVLLGLGLLCVRVRLWGKARSYLTRCIELDPSPHALLALAALEREVGDRAQSQRLVERTLAELDRRAAAGTGPSGV